MPSQFAKPELHVIVLHMPAVQAAVAFGREHVLPQAPQFPSDVLRSTSQPLDGLPSQSPKPGAHVR